MSYIEEWAKDFMSKKNSEAFAHRPILIFLWLQDLAEAIIKDSQSDSKDKQ